MKAAIEVQHIVKKFGDFTAIDDISFSVDQGEIFGLLGPNGAGKSTLIRMLTTLIPPTSGSARVDGIDVVEDPNGVRKVIGVIPQAMTSDLELSVYENLLIFAKLYGVPREKRNALIADLLEQVELTKWANEQVKKLSGGMRRRVEIARGLVHHPRVLFLDEPTTGLDPVSRAAVWEMVRKLKEQHELTVLLTTHYMDEADDWCDRIAIVDHGHLMALDSPIRLKASIPGDEHDRGELRRCAVRLAHEPRVAPGSRARDGRRKRRANRDGQRPRDDDRADVDRGGRRRARAVARRAEYDARQCIRALHGPATARRASGAVGGGQVRDGQSRPIGERHASYLGHHREGAAALPA